MKTDSWANYTGTDNIIRCEKCGQPMPVEYLTSDVVCFTCPCDEATTEGGHG